MINVSSIKAPRPAVDWFSTTERAEPASADATLPADRVSLSPEARSQLARAGAGGRASEAGGSDQPEPAGREEQQGGGTAVGRGGRLTPEQRQEVQELQRRDAHVRAHEAAHQAAGGDLTGPASFSYQLGPDGRSYAVGGEVPVQARSGRTPDETIAIARRVRAAALAPADPSAADLAAAAAASQVEARATQQKRQQGLDGPARAAAGAPATSRAASLERLVVRAPEAEPFL